MSTSSRTDIKKATVGELEIAYETFGNPTDPPVLLVMGLNTQMLAWPDELCEDIVATGRYVVRFDNRDVGLSTHLDHLPVPQPTRVLLRLEKAPYSIGDMARDALGLMDVLGFESVDLVGASMGGFIAQSMAIQAPERIRTLTLMMSSTGSRLVGRPAARISRDMLRRRPVRTREEAMAAAVDVFTAIGSPGYALDRERLEEMAGTSYDRGYNPRGYLRQLAAVLSQPDRTRKLRRLDIPTLVMHGLNDPLVAPSGGLALARTIPGAKFVGFSGMGHDLPRALWKPMAEEIASLVRTPART